MKHLSSCHSPFFVSSGRKPLFRSSIVKKNCPVTAFFHYCPTNGTVLCYKKASLLALDDSFKKIVIVRDIVKPFHDEHGILTISLFDFLMKPGSLEY